MKPGLKVGMSASLEITVTEDMFAVFDEEVVHPAYSTASMVKHMEQVSRQLILPFLESHEESAGAKVTMTHIAPTPVGSAVKNVAMLTDFNEKTVTTEVVVKNEIGVIGKGTVTIALLPNGYMEKQLKNIQDKIATEGL